MRAAWSPMTQAPPIQATLERAGARFAHLGVRFGPAPSGWRRASEIVHDPQAVRVLLEQVCDFYHIADRQVAASFLVLGYFWYPLAGAMACYLLERRLPDLAPAAVAIDVRGAAFTSPRCWALPDDPDAGHPDVSVMPVAAALRAQLVGQLEEHAAPLFTTLRSVAPYGVTAMRANYADRLASALLWLAEELGNPDLARREVPAFVALLPGTPRTGLLEVEQDGRHGVFLRRAGCCLNYRLLGQVKCDTCPLWPLAERVALLSRRL
jgi:hypothetical protein